MLARVWSAAIVGIDAVKVGVEVDIAGGLPAMVVVGLPDTAVQESRERTKAAIKNAGFPFPMRKIVINLTPADLRKEGPSFDLPISVGILAASEQVNGDLLNDLLFLGEMSLENCTIHGQTLKPLPLGRFGGFRLLVPPRRRNEDHRRGLGLRWLLRRLFGWLLHRWELREKNAEAPSRERVQRVLLRVEGGDLVC
jgi:hypothetical protein